MSEALPTEHEFALLNRHLTNVRVLALGEPTHGTAEAFRWKFEVISALANAGTLRVLAWECGFATGRLLDHALRFGGDLEAALRAQKFWTWNTREILAGFQALQAWNLGQPAEKRIRLVGVDVQNPYLGVQELIHAGHTAALLQLLTEKGRLEAGQPEARELMTALEEIERIEDDPLRRSYARNARRFVETYLLEPAHGRLGLRDTYMAQTLLEEGLNDSGLTVFWSHNEHVAANPDFAGDAASGFVLRESLGPAYLSVGMLLGQGHFRVRDLDALGQPKPLAELPIDLPQPHHSDALFLDQPAGLSAVQDYPHAGPRRFLGGHYGLEAAATKPDRFEMPRPLSDFDLIRWFPLTTAAHGLSDES